MATDTAGTIPLTEARGVRGVAFRDHLCIRRYLCGLWGYLRNHLCRWAREEVGTIERGRWIRVGVGIESEGDMEGQTREAGTDMEKTEGATVVGSVGVYRIHRVRASVTRVLPTSHSRWRCVCVGLNVDFEDSSIFASNAPPHRCCLALYTHTFIS